MAAVVTAQRVMDDLKSLEPLVNAAKTALDAALESLEPQAGPAPPVSPPPTAAAAPLPVVRSVTSQQPPAVKRAKPRASLSPSSGKFVVRLHIYSTGKLLTKDAIKTFLAQYLPNVELVDDASVTPVIVVFFAAARWFDASKPILKALNLESDNIAGFVVLQAKDRGTLVPIPPSGNGVPAVYLYMHSDKPLIFSASNTDSATQAMGEHNDNIGKTIMQWIDS